MANGGSAQKNWIHGRFDAKPGAFGASVHFIKRQVLRRDIGDLGEAIHARKAIPVVMIRNDVKAVLRNLSNDKWLMASLMDGDGLQLMECLRLRVQDIDFAR